MKKTNALLSTLLIGTSMFQSTSRASFTPYPAANRNLVKLSALSPDNLDWLDPMNPIKDQGAIASCASHGQMALLESQLYLEHGITLQLSERYHLYSSFLETANMGSDPNVITQFPNIITKYGVMPSSVYPYSEILVNAPRFTQDAAQGLKTDVNNDSLDVQIKQFPAGPARSRLLQEPRYLGSLPKGPFPIPLPLKVLAIRQDASIPEFEDRRKQGKPRVIPCFTTSNVSPQITVTPQEFLNLCLNHEPKKYFTCQIDMQLSADRLFAGKAPQDLCKDIQSAATQVTEDIASRRLSLLNLTLRLLENGQAVLIGVDDPAQGQVLSVWYSKLQGNAGHAVAAIGFLTIDELKDPAEHSKGLLKDGIFDALAASLDQSLIAAGIFPGESFQILATDSAETIYNKRLGSNLGKLISKEGGILFFRNSWGTLVGQTPIGAGGYQSMTFDYFLKNATLVMSQQRKALADVAWQAGPGTCPVDFQSIGSQHPSVQNRVVDLSADHLKFSAILQQICPK